MVKQIAFSTDDQEITIIPTNINRHLDGYRINQEFRTTSLFTVNLELFMVQFICLFVTSPTIWLFVYAISVMGQSKPRIHPGRIRRLRVAYGLYLGAGADKDLYWLRKYGFDDPSHFCPKHMPLRHELPKSSDSAIVSASKEFLESMCRFLMTIGLVGCYVIDTGLAVAANISTAIYGDTNCLAQVYVDCHAKFDSNSSFIANSRFTGQEPDLTLQFREVFVSTPRGTLTIKFRGVLSLLGLKFILLQHHNVPLDKFYYTFDGRTLGDDFDLTSCMELTVQMCPRLHGGVGSSCSEGSLAGTEPAPNVGPTFDTSMGRWRSSAGNFMSQEDALDLLLEMRKASKANDMPGRVAPNTESEQSSEQTTAPKNADGGKIYVKKEPELASFAVPASDATLECRVQCVADWVASVGSWVESAYESGPQAWALTIHASQEFFESWFALSYDPMTQGELTLAEIDMPESAGAFDAFFSRGQHIIMKSLPTQLAADLTTEMSIEILTPFQKFVAAIVAIRREYDVQDDDEKIELQRKLENPISWVAGNAGSEYYRQLMSYKRLAIKVNAYAPLMWDRVAKGVRDLHTHVLSHFNDTEKSCVLDWYKSAGIASFDCECDALLKYVSAIASMCKKSEGITKIQERKKTDPPTNAPTAYAANVLDKPCFVCQKPLREHGAGTHNGHAVVHKFCNRPNGAAPGVGRG